MVNICIYITYSVFPLFCVLRELRIHSYKQRIKYTQVVDIVNTFDIFFKQYKFFHLLSVSLHLSLFREISGYNVGDYEENFWKVTPCNMVDYLIYTVFI
jgi:hypothetical protein